ncbi:hypothetical protein HX109_12730 [Galbibacter sp. BG1]|uniref:hypothetical protein n=1 Tax=Galbibacter sp. BG1 TaxID=1170699 RepID=UPI0015C1B429|nr:hypothetical protein [Galbibacter sp. BG1]QLE02378.1 hypothetical protein HX109_12730 [Galbibacter sp. BG1]
MILHSLHFAKKIDDINQILWKDELEITSLSRMIFRKFNKKEVLHYYDLIFKNFPLEIEEANQEISVSVFATEIFELHYELIELDNQLSIDKKNELLEKRKTFKPEHNSETIEDFISTFFHCLVYNYEDFLANTLKQHYFVGINDETKILLSILNRYKSVLKDKTKQIDLFWCVKLNKQISDLILEMLIEFIEQRLNLLTISTENLSIGNELNYVENNIFSIDWNGSQQELCELILELEKKGWIAEIKNGDRRKFANSLTKIFNLTSTKKNKKSNQNNSFYQLLKGEFENNERIYPFMEKENYKKQFNGIIENENKLK